MCQDPEIVIKIEFLKDNFWPLSDFLGKQPQIVSLIGALVAKFYDRRDGYYARIDNSAPFQFSDNPLQGFGSIDQAEVLQEVLDTYLRDEEIDISALKDAIIEIFDNSDAGQ